jgi:hypothetical protein
LPAISSTTSSLSTSESVETVSIEPGPMKRARPPMPAARPAAAHAREGRVAGVVSPDGLAGCREATGTKLSLRFMVIPFEMVVWKSVSDRGAGTVVIT